jgi:DNA-binding response OmpR family regulator
VERVLVIYDDSRSQQEVQEILEPVGYSVTAAPCGAIAMEVFRSTPPDLVILDVSLPGRWVEEFCREIRARSTAVRLIVLSAVSDVTEVILLLELGADDYITKPFSPWEFLTRVRTSMRHFKPC